MIQRSRGETYNVPVTVFIVSMKYATVVGLWLVVFLYVVLFHAWFIAVYMWSFVYVYVYVFTYYYLWAQMYSRMFTFSAYTLMILVYL